LAVLGVPLLIGGISSTSAGFVDIVMMGHYDAADLAAVSGGSAVFDIFSTIVLGSLTGHQILAARFAGRGDPAGIARSLRSSIWFSGGIALALAVLSMAGGGWLTGLLTGGSAQLSAIGAGYLMARAPTLLLLVPFTLLTAILGAYRRTRPIMLATITVNVVNLLLDVILIFGPGGLPRLGAVGNGLATTIAWTVGVVMLAVVALRSGMPALLRQPAVATPIDFVTSIVRLSAPAILSFGLDNASNAVFFAIVAGISANALAGGRIAFELIVMLFGVGAAFAAAERILIGRSLGRQRPEAVPDLWRAGIRVTIGPAFVIAFPLVVFPGAVAGVFTSFPAVQSVSSDAIRLAGVCVPLMAWTLANVSVLRAFGKTSWDMFGNLTSALCLQLPLAWLLGYVGHQGITGCFLAVVSYWLARAAVTELLAQRLVAGQTMPVGSAAATLTSTPT
jgi:MATE family multidrug resistance protein